MGVVTKTGDAGETGLVGGDRVSKSDQRIDVYGELDELNSYIGLAISVLDKKRFKKELEFLTRLQSMIFDMGSQFACPAEKRESFKLPNISEKDIVELEELILKYEQSLPELTKFILPGGVQSSSLIHVCRTITRKIERKVVGLEKTVALPEHSRHFLNRLSDYFFILSRYINIESGDEEKLWKGRS